MDSNADTCCAGSNFLIMSMTRRTADVFPYDAENYKPLYNVPIVSAATAYDDPITGQTYILILNECLYYGTKLDHSLINPNQLCHGGCPVWDNPYDEYHDISIECDESLTVSLTMRGTKTYFVTRVPTDSELHNCPHVNLTSSDEWEPATVHLQSVASSPSDSDDWRVQRHVSTLTTSPEPGDKFSYTDIKTDECILHEINPVLVRLSELHTEMQHDVPSRNTFISNERHKRHDAISLADTWGIGINRAKATLNCTTQRSKRSAILPLSRRYQADRMYDMKHLNSRFATDTFYADQKSLNQNTCAQIYSHKNGFTAVYPMERATGDTIGQSLLNFGHDFGIPEHLTFDGASAQVGKNTLFMKTI